MKRLDHPTDRLIYKREILEIVGCCYTTLWHLMSKGEFPRAHKVGVRVAWRASDVQRWLDQLPKSRLKGGEQ